MPGFSSTKLVRCAPRAGRTGATTRAPAAVSQRRTRSQHHAPCQPRCTRTNGATGIGAMIGPGTYMPNTYASAMAITTIRVDRGVRDRLAARAANHGRSLGAELEAILEELEWQAIEAGYQRLA